jgi:hypothetical protein
MAGNPPTVPIPAQDTEPVSAVDIHPDDPDDEWVVDRARRGIRIRAVTGVLLLLGVLGGGFWGGVIAEKHHGSGNSANSSLASQIAALRTSRTAGGGTGTTGNGSTAGAGAFLGGGGSATRGTVIGVQGDVLEISDNSGDIVKVTVGPSATVTRTAASSLGGLQIGDTVVVAGSAGTNGTINATAVRASAKGVTTGGVGGGAFTPGGGG